VELFQEGAVRFFAQNKQTRSSEVFFNPTRKFDRDLNVSIFNCLGKKKLVGLDLLAASGVRGLRLAVETNAFRKIIINDIKTTEIIKKNIKLNSRSLNSRVSATDLNALYLGRLEEKLDYIDIDPFGSPVRYLPFIISKVRTGGIVSITSTDTAALFGKARKACLLRYSAVSFKTGYYNELGLRILIKRSEEIANVYERSVSPLLFDVRQHYVRAYLKVTSPVLSDSRIGFLYQCRRCPYRTISEVAVCPHCGGSTIRLGPIWLGKLFDRALVTAIASGCSNGTVREYLYALSAESYTLSYYTTPEIASFFKLREVGPLKLGLRTVFNPKGFRTDNSLEEIQIALLKENANG
jgi:tRNA (guanine26-N2/guanine27-N2)-dimethyltransferase